MTIHFALPALDVDASVAFYRALGFVVEHDYTKPQDGLRVVRLALDGEFVIELMHAPEMHDLGFDQAPEWHHLGLRVDDIDATLASLKHIHLQIIKPVTPGSAVKRYVFVADPSGVPVELFEATDS